MRSVPALTVTVPVLSRTPVTVSRPAPVFVRDPGPVKPPVDNRSEALLTVAFAPRASVKASVCVAPVAKMSGPAPFSVTAPESE